MTIAEVKNEARRLSIRWADVRDLAAQLWDDEKQKREHANAVRQSAWILATVHTPGAWAFWRHGFEKRWGRRVAEGDYTAVPKYDTITQEIACEFPEYAGDDGAARLFDFLFSPYDRLPAKGEIYAAALELIAAQPAEVVPF